MDQGVPPHRLQAKRSAPRTQLTRQLINAMATRAHQRAPAASAPTLLAAGSCRYETCDCPELLASLHRKFDALDAKFDALGGNFDALGGKLDTLHAKLDALPMRVIELLQQHQVPVSALPAVAAASTDTDDHDDRVKRHRGSVVHWKPAGSRAMPSDTSSHTCSNFAAKSGTGGVVRYCKHCGKHADAHAMS